MYALFIGPSPSPRPSPCPSPGSVACWLLPVGYCHPSYDVVRAYGFASKSGKTTNENDN